MKMKYTCIVFREGSLLTIALGEIASLNHEVLNNSVEGRAFITESLLAGGQCASEQS